MFKKGDIGLVKDFTENTFVRNIYTYKKKIFISPGTTGLILNKNSKFTLVLTPKKRIIKLGLKSIGQFCSSTLKKKKKKIHEKASVIKYLKVRSRVLGKSMNICDRPNGGYKHASKILKNFKSRKILK